MISMTKIGHISHNYLSSEKELLVKTKASSFDVEGFYVVLFPESAPRGG